MARQATAVTLALAVALALSWAVACGGGSQGGGLSLEADDFYFEPKEIRAQAGQPLTLRIENEGRVPHTFSVEPLGVDVELAPGEERTVTFTPTGEAEFVCRFHQAQGMRGRIVLARGAATGY
jgi:plastocyanin